jgi:hypothetical protein
MNTNLQEDILKRLDFIRLNGSDKVEVLRLLDTPASLWTVDEHQFMYSVLYRVRNKEGKKIIMGCWIVAAAIVLIILVVYSYLKSQ